MTARRKISQFEDPVEVNVDMAGLSHADRDAIEKDLCLIKAALAADGIIVTRDDSLQRALAKTRDGARLLRTIKWLNPVTDGKAAIESL
jgi:rRNA-processing protein FCF1